MKKPKTIMKKLLFLTLAFLGTLTTAEAQNSGSISGTLTDTNNQPLLGVSVIIEGTSKGASTDFDGKYLISNVSAGTYTITASYIGYKSISSQININAIDVVQDFSLEEDLLSLDAIDCYRFFQAPEQKLESSVAITTMNAPRKLKIKHL